MQEIDAGALTTRIESDGEGLRIVDVRSPAAFRDGHIPGSENVPMRELADGAETLAGAETVVTVCPHGQASLKAARILGAYEGLQDAEIYSLEGGLTAWDGALESSEDSDDAESDESEASGDVGGAAKGETSEGTAGSAGADPAAETEAPF